MRKLALILALVFCAVVSSAQQKDTSMLRTAMQWSDPMVSAGNGRAADFSNLAMLLSEYMSHSEASLGLDFRNESKAYYPQEGDGLTMGSFNASSFLRTSGNSSVSGAVCYQRGVKRNVVWNETSDYSILFPYVQTDSVGGNMQSEQYSFEGAYSHRSGKLLYSIGASYRALHEYRTVDPRPRNITSDLTVSGSLAQDFGKYILCEDISYRRYNQTQSVAFVSTLGANTVLFHSTGLLNDYVRFQSTGTFASTLYSGNGFSASALLKKADGRFFAGAGYSFMDFIQSLTSQNEAPITDLGVHSGDIFCCYKKTSGEYHYAVEGVASGSFRHGVENVIDNTAEGTYRKLMGLEMYSCSTLDGTVSGIIQKTKSRFSLDFDPSVTYSSSAERYEYPSESMKYSSILGKAGFGMTRLMDKSLLRLEAAFSYKANVGKSLSMEYSDSHARIYSAYKDMFSMFTSNRTGLSIGGRFERMIGARMDAFASMNLTEYIYQGGISGTFARVSLGITF